MSPRSDKPRQRRVALLIESSRAYAREVIRGIAHHNRKHQNWLLEFTPRGLEDPPPAWLKSWHGDGILARVNDRRMASALRRKGLPVVDLRRLIAVQGIPWVGPDDADACRLVWEHFRDRGFTRFAFVGEPAGVHRAMDARADHFGEVVGRSGASYFEIRLDVPAAGDRWDKQCRQLRRWLGKLPLPIAVMACNDDMGLRVLDACRRASLRVPDEVAVAGVGNDECLCDLSLPQLTSVHLNPQRIGYEAAALLDRMMDGEPLEQQEYLIAPQGIVSRMSTDVVATEDPLVAEAIGFIRSHACDGIDVGAVCRHVCRSRGALEPRFKQILGRTVHNEIQRVRLSRVRDLLATTDMPIKQIARETGFRYAEYLMRVFRQTTGTTLKDYRVEYRLRSGKGG
ncbi:MAG: substrate-binding domain-containing protein [Planctomycetaceae bacterium]|nr:substrate-binding domain-containing protein [Planctomycetaceae bacterium]